MHLQRNVTYVCWHVLHLHSACLFPRPSMHFKMPAQSICLCATAGPSLRMFDAAAGWVVKRIRARHMHAPSSPQQLAAVASVFAQLQHKSVVVPELLNALSSQVRATEQVAESKAAVGTCTRVTY